MLNEQPVKKPKQADAAIAKKQEESKSSVYLAKSNSDSQVQAPTNYEFVRTIGDGSFGKVKLGVHQLTGQKVAIKILYKERIKEKTDIERISRQIKIMKAIRHPFLVQTYEIIQSPKYLFLVMEYIEGGDLFDAISNCGKLAEDISRRYFSQILLGLEYLHSVGITHRDMKPQNILIGENGKIKIADFGLGNFFTEDQKLKTACGSPCYAPPQMLNQEEYDPRKVDIWSSGVILYAMVHGYLPFQDDVQSLLYEKIKTKNVRFASYISIPCRNLLRGLLIKDQKERWSTATIKVHQFLSEVIHKEQDYAKDELAEINLEEFKQICDYLGISQEDHSRLLNNVKKNKHNNLTTLYYLGKKKLLRETLQKQQECKSEKVIDIQVQKQEKPEIFEKVEFNPLTNSDKKPFSFFDRDQISFKAEEKQQQYVIKQKVLIQSKLIQSGLSRINENSQNLQLQQSANSLSSVNAKTPDSNNEAPVPRSPPQQFTISAEQNQEIKVQKVVKNQKLIKEEALPQLKIGKKIETKAIQPSMNKIQKTESFKKQDKPLKANTRGNLKKSERMPIYKPKEELNKIIETQVKLYERSQSKDKPIILKNNLLNGKSGVFKDKKPQACNVISKQVYIQPHLIDCQRLVLISAENLCESLSKKGLTGKIQYFDYSKQCILVVKSQLKSKQGSKALTNELQKIIIQINQLAAS